MLSNVSYPPASWAGPYSHIKQLLGACLLHTEPLPLLSRYRRTAAKPNTQRYLHPQIISSQHVPPCKRFQSRKPLRWVELQ